MAAARAFLCYRDMRTRRRSKKIMQKIVAVKKARTKPNEKIATKKLKRKSNKNKKQHANARTKNEAAGERG